MAEAELGRLLPASLPTVRPHPPPTSPFLTNPSPSCVPPTVTGILVCLGRHPQVGPALFLDAAANLLQLSSAGKGVTAPKSQPLSSARGGTGPSAVSGNAAADLRAAVTDLLRTAMASAAAQDAPTGCALLVALTMAAQRSRVSRRSQAG